MRLINVSLLVKESAIQGTELLLKRQVFSSWPLQQKCYSRNKFGKKPGCLNYKITRILTFNVSWSFFRALFLVMKFDASPASYFAFCLGLLPMIEFYLKPCNKENLLHNKTLLQLEILGSYNLSACMTWTKVCTIMASGKIRTWGWGKASSWWGMVGRVVWGRAGQTKRVWWVWKTISGNLWKTHQYSFWLITNIENSNLQMLE